ncbi:MAG: sigma-70 family RNA polymerase sigma factor [Steroidobacteraceae bacterium]
MTTTMPSSVGAYLEEIGRVPLLTPEQEIELGRKVRRMQELHSLTRPLTKAEEREVRMGRRAAERFVTANLRLVVSIAKKYQRMTHSLDLMDLVQEGNLGLIQGVAKFDPERGYKFSTYVYWWVRQAMSRAIRYKDRMVRLPGQISEMAYSWNVRRQKLMAKLDREPTIQEMAKAFRVDMDEVMLFRERGGKATSLDLMIGQNEDSTILEMVADPRDAEGEEAIEQALISEMGSAVREALVHLDPKDRMAVELRYGLTGEQPMTLKELGAQLGVTHEAARLRLTRACNRLRILLRSTYASEDNLVASLAA